MNDLIARREQLIAMRTMERNRMTKANPLSVEKSLKKIIGTLDEQVADIDAILQSSKKLDGDSSGIASNAGASLNFVRSPLL